jgi:hypothetical protein
MVESIRETFALEEAHRHGAQVDWAHRKEPMTARGDEFRSAVRGPWPFMQRLLPILQ